MTATILLVLSVGMYFTVTESVIGAGKDIQKTNDGYITALANADELIKERDQVLRNYNAIPQEDRDRLDKMVPSTVDNIRLIIDIGTLAVKHGFQVKNIKAVTNTPQNTPGVVAPAVSSAAAPASAADATLQGINPQLDTVTVTFEASAPIAQFESFLNDLESSLRIVDVNKMELAVDESATGGNNYNYSVGLTTYWLRQP